jgi:hypothetical protein
VCTRHLGARVRDLAEDGLLLARRALHGLDQVADQVAPALELVVHLRPLVLDLGLLTDERVVVAGHTAAEGEQRQHHDRQHHHPALHRSLLLSRTTPCA